MDIPLVESDKNLSLALGSTETGASLINITGAYTTFANGGKYSKPSCIESISQLNNSIIKKRYGNEKQIVGEDTAYIMNDILQNTVTNGTAKKLEFSGLTLCAKTGTVGNSKGNSDAYSISYNPEYILGVWFGNKNGELMPNSITGGGLPTQLACEIWKEIYSDNSVPEFFYPPKSVVETYIDKTNYEQNDLVVLADDLAPERLKIKAVFKKSAIPKLKSTSYSLPKIENYKTLVINNSICIELCLTKYCDARIYRLNGNSKKLVFDTKNSGLTFTDKNLKYNAEYYYSIIPYFNYDNKEILGEEILLNKIKTPNGEFGENWWNNEFD